jgi:hypothetical protein
MKITAHEKDSRNENVHNNNELKLRKHCLQRFELYQFIDYLHRVKNTGLLKKINKSHRYTAEQEDY